MRHAQAQGTVEDHSNVEASPEPSSDSVMHLDPARVSPIANMLELSNAEMASLLASGGHHSNRGVDEAGDGDAMDVAAALGMGAEEIDIVEGTYAGGS